MLAEVDKKLPVLTGINKENLSRKRSMVISGGIEELRNLQEKENRNLKKEKRIVRVVNQACNCDGKDKFSSPTFFSSVSCSFENPISISVSEERSIFLMGKFLFLGLAQGDEKKPWIKTSEENEWYLKFVSGKHGLNYNILYYAPVKGIENLKINASEF